MGLWTAAFQALGSALSSRSADSASRRQRKEDRAARQAELEANMAEARAAALWDRGNFLQDRRYKEETLAPYGQFAHDQSLPEPTYTDTTPTPMAPRADFVPAPPAPPPKKPSRHGKKSGLMGGGL